MQIEKTGNSDGISKTVDLLTFRDWWHLLARYTSVIESKDTVRTALKIMAHRGFRHLPVVSSSSLYGIVSAGDLVDLFTSEEFPARTSVEGSIGFEMETKLQGDRLISSLENHVSTIANKHPITVSPNATILDAIRVVGEKNIGSLLIVEVLKNRDSGETAKHEQTLPINDGKLIGIVTLRDIVSILAAYGPFGVRVEDCMTSDVSTANEKDPIYSAMKLMAKKGVRRLPVITSAKSAETGAAVLGMITNKMVLRYLESIISYETLDVKQAIKQPVRTVMASTMPLIDPREDCGNAAYLMREMGTGGFAVVDSRGLVGVITERDLISRVYKKEGLSFFSELFEKGNIRMQV